MMFGKSKSSSKFFTNLISFGTHVEGRIDFTGVLLIEGSVHGNISMICEGNPNKNTENCLVLEPKGVIISDKVETPNATISGNITAQMMRVENELKITSSASIKGATIYYRTLSIEPGAQLIGCELKHLDFCSEGEIV